MLCLPCRAPGQTVDGDQCGLGVLGTSGVYFQTFLSKFKPFSNWLVIGLERRNGTALLWKSGHFWLGAGVG
jgi:hypothetical protein